MPTPPKPLARAVVGERTVTERQLEVLMWVVAGCPDGIMENPTYKTTAVALQNRRLVTVTKRGGVWKAVPTDAGRYFAVNGSYPMGHWATSSKGQPKPKSPSPPNRTRSKERLVTGLRPVDQMLADVAEAGGSLDVTDTKGHYSSLVSSANRHGKVPGGKHLQTVSRRGWGEKTVRLVDKPEWMTADLDAIAVTDRLSKPHLAVVALRTDKTC